MSATNHLRVTLAAGDDAREYDLKPSLKAATAVSNKFNGFSNALGALAASDMAAINFVLRQGISVKEIAADKLEQAIYEAGTRNVVTDAMKFVSRLANGGRDPAETDEDEAAKGELDDE